MSEDLTMDLAPRDARAHVGLRVLQLGAVAVIVAACTWKEYELDRFFVPKELSLHLTALVAGALAARSFRRMRASPVDLLLIAVLALGAVSAVFATNHWLALRALTITASGVLIFWAARAVRVAGASRPLLAGLAFAVFAGAVSSLLQTYGVETELFSINRAPGGTLGNRNFVAHLAAFGFPLLLLVALRASTGAGYVLSAAGIAVVAGTLIITRSRAAWLAFAAVLLVFFASMIAARALRRDGRTWRRMAGLLVLAASGVAGALLVPNTLEWRSDNPYLESLTEVANYQEGSGRGRLIQYRRTLQMAVGSPLLGVGPGNWAVEYPEHAEGGDPSMDGNQAGMTSNPWPSSDWVAFIAERGLVATLLLGLAFTSIVIGSMRRVTRTEDPADALAGAAVIGTVVGAGVAGAFDAVLLLALPTLIVWAVLGALWVPRQDTPAEALETASPVRFAGLVRPAFVLLLVVAAAGALRSTLQLTAMGIDSQTGSTAWRARAAVLDPGNYRLRLRLARSSSGLPRETRCEHATAARALFPSASAARDLSAGC
ncbi:MAG: O-antigen ligase family protein [Gemmatimonadota bacterium]